MVGASRRPKKKSFVHGDRSGIENRSGKSSPMTAARRLPEHTHKKRHPPESLDQTGVERFESFIEDGSKMGGKGLKMTDPRKKR